MAMRPRARGGRAGPNREPRSTVGRVYEQFKPMSEWRQEDDYDTLLVYLPGFQKEYIKVTTEDLNIVRIRGERLVAENKWSRFQEDFRVPENCEMRGVRARFDGGILTITMPRKMVTTPPPPPTTTTTTATPRVTPKSEEPPFRRTTQQKPPTPTTTPRVDPISEEPPFRRTEQQETLAQKPKDQESKERATSSNAALESEKKSEKPQTPLEGSTSTLPMPAKQEPLSSVAKKDQDDGVEKPDNKGNINEAVVEEEKKMGLESIKRESKDAGGSQGGEVEENAVVKGGNGWRGLNEDRKMVVNMGVGVLVIVALGVHVSYTIGLIGKGK